MNFYLKYLIYLNKWKPISDWKLLFSIEKIESIFVHSSWYIHQCLKQIEQGECYEIKYRRWIYYLDNYLIVVWKNNRTYNLLIANQRNFLLMSCLRFILLNKCLHVARSINISEYYHKTKNLTYKLLNIHFSYF